MMLQVTVIRMSGFSHPHTLLFGEVVGYTQNADGTITLTVDGVRTDFGEDYVFTDRIVVQPFADGTFRYLSNEYSDNGVQDLPQ